MMTSETMQNVLGDKKQIAVERAIAEFRAGRPVIIQHNDRQLVALATEGINENILQFFISLDQKPQLILSAEAAKAPAPSGWPVSSVELVPFTYTTLSSFLSFADISANDATAFHLSKTIPGEAEKAALMLSSLAFLLPAVIVTPVDTKDFKEAAFVTVTAKDIDSFREHEAKALKIVARTAVPLENAPYSEFVIFRGGDGFRDQVAIIVGNPPKDKPVLVRIHSACLTGDIFGSLKCDCGDQLRGTVEVMTKQGGGVVLYLDQEGRGNGIANKIRAYGFQSEGLDTYDADAKLGFGQDQRRFDFAADMLKLLDFKHIRLMTNNPQKIEALQSAGLEVVSTHRVISKPTTHNAKYLSAKREKAGHLLDLAAFDSIDLQGIVKLGGK